MSHRNTTMLVSFKLAIDIAEYKIEEYKVKLLSNDGRESFYDRAITIGNIIKNMYIAFDTKAFDKLYELNKSYNEELIATLEILELLVKQNIYNENDYISYANSFMKWKQEYDILCENPYIVNGISLCECCIPKYK